jgi:hypothetical protein
MTESRRIGHIAVAIDKAWDIRGKNEGKRDRRRDPAAIKTTLSQMRKNKA